MLIQGGKLQKIVFLFLLGGFLYCTIEILFRGFSHISMFVDGGLCFCLIGSLNDLFRRELSLLTQMVLSVMIITTVELVTGLIVNVWLRLGVWDYSLLQFNFMGQISLLFCVLWFFLSFPAIVLYDYIRYWFMGGEKPHYKVL